MKHYVRVKNNRFKNVISFFDISAAPEVTTEDGEKDVEVAFSSSEWHWGGGGLQWGALFFMAVGLWVLEVVTVENVSKSSSI